MGVDMQVDRTREVDRAREVEFAISTLDVICHIPVYGWPGRPADLNTLYPYNLSVSWAEDNLSGIRAGDSEGFGGMRRRFVDSIMNHFELLLTTMLRFDWRNTP